MKGSFSCLEELKFLDSSSIGRRRPLYTDEDDFYLGMDNPFSVDENRKIRLSKSHRRMENKTQVFYDSGTPYTRSRLIHTDEVVVMVSFLARILGLNISLARAVAAGHDIGHVPYGHLGERFLSSVVKGEFRHSAFGVIVAELIERRGVGLNLSYEVLEGIYCHSGNLDNFKEDIPQEHLLVKISDKVAYTVTDYNDAQRMGYVTEENEHFKLLGDNQRERILTLQKAILQESIEKKKVSFEDSMEAKYFKKAREFMFDKVYAAADKRIDHSVIERAYEYIEKSSEFSGCNPVLVFALLSEEEVKLLSQIAKTKSISLKKTGIMEVLPDVKGLKISDFSNFPFKKSDFSKQ